VGKLSPSSENGNNSVHVVFGLQYSFYGMSVGGVGGWVSEIHLPVIVTFSEFFAMLEAQQG
jgi:hypothetical protein